MKIMVVFVTLFFAAFTQSEGFAKERPVDHPECKDITARLIQFTNAEFERFSPLADNVFLRQAIAGEIVLSCTSHRLTGVSLSWENAYPSNNWFAIAADAGRAVSGVDSKSLELAIRKCHRTALKDKSELFDLEINNARIECQAFTRDGGGVTVSVWINDHEARNGIEDR
jgi:hypothetical protein